VLCVQVLDGSVDTRVYCVAAVQALPGNAIEEIDTLIVWMLFVWCYVCTKGVLYLLHWVLLRDHNAPRHTEACNVHLAFEGLWLRIHVCTCDEGLWAVELGVRTKSRKAAAFSARMMLVWVVCPLAYTARMNCEVLEAQCVYSICRCSWWFIILPVWSSSV
jgi:hypothetical protein